MEKIFTLYIYWDPSAAMLPWNLPLLDRPLLWYGFFFALGFFLGYLVFKSLLKKFLDPYQVKPQERGKIIEKLSLYIFLGTLLGAKLFDMLFYQNPEDYVHDPLRLFRFWEGGLASHGGVIGVALGLWFFSLKIKKEWPMLTWVALFDLLCIPEILAGGFIRIGNFFNQEIVGTATNVPWAIMFGHPADGSISLPRHPVQLYESLFYFVFAALLWKIRSHYPKMSRLGKTAGLAFIGIFTFRFFIEFFKAPQSAIIPSGSFLDMGQWLSIPLVLLGFLLFFGYQDRLRPRSVKRE